MLDPDPDETNADPQPWFGRTQIGLGKGQFGREQLGQAPIGQGSTVQLGQAQLGASSATKGILD